MALKENTKRVITYLQEINGKPVTAADVADALGMEKRSVDGIFTSAIQKKGLGVRTPAEVELEDGTHKAIKLLSLTDAGMALDVDAADAE
jgi:Mn-dependent DtxR family transcriptional regulator